MVDSEIKYCIRVSMKAKHVHLKMTVENGLEIVVPRGFDRCRIPRLLDEKRRWIQKAREKIAEHRQHFEPGQREGLPDLLILTALNETWRIDYRATASRRVSLLGADGLLIIAGRIENLPLCREVLRRWLKRRFGETIVNWLNAMGKQMKFSFGKVAVKSQKTRWASCSQDRAISLNHKLLFLPEHLVRYVLLHELCHTVILNHSTRFWSLVRRLEPRYRELDRELRDAWSYVPPWLEQGG